MKTKNLVLLTIFAATCIAGCGTQPVTDTPKEPSAGQETSGGHSHGAGPHDGTLADWGGGKYHVEFTVDHAKQEATVYVLGSDATSPMPIPSEKVLLSITSPDFQTDLLPVPMDGDAPGTSSRFVGTHQDLGIVQEYTGTLSAEVDGTPYAGNFKEEPHDE